MPHETANRGAARCRYFGKGTGSGRHVPCPRTTSAISQVRSKPYYTLELTVVEPQRLGGSAISSRIYCNPRALWKLNWFLRDFGYDRELLDENEVDERRLVGLVGVIKISNVVYDNMALTRFDGFAPEDRWNELSPSHNLDQQAS